MPEQIPLRTQLSLVLSDLPNSPSYASSVLGYGRYGLQLSLPQLLTTTYSLPAQAKLTCTYISPTGQDLLAFHSYVMGYEQAAIPVMVIAFPTAIAASTRRSARRFPIELPVGYLSDASGVFGERTTTVDISFGGLRMKTCRPIREGAPISLTLELPDETLVLPGGVMWSGFRGKICMTGVRFSPLKSATSASLAKYLNGLERQLAGLSPAR